MRKLSQRKIKPAGDSVGSGLEPSAASMGSAMKKKIRREHEANARKRRKDFIGPSRLENCPARKGVPREWLLQYHSPEHRWIAPDPLAPTQHRPQCLFSFLGARSERRLERHLSWTGACPKDRGGWDPA